LHLNHNKKLKATGKATMNELEEVKMLKRFKHLPFAEKVEIICRGIKVLAKKRISNECRR
jgi:hypothetical protein